jgi:thioredoxin reductase/ferredoxin
VAYVVPAVLGGLALAVMALVSTYASRKRARSLRQPAHVHVARVLIHSINDDRCTGCDACVAVCPTNVLDLVENKSRVLQFQDCIQCEACMWACPTTALVMHPEGTEPPLYKMPELDQHYQTAVAGQYLIGEVAGKPLVKNAANLGRGVVEHMVATGLRPAGRSEIVDVAIVGSGPGGLSAGLTCIHRGLSYVILDKENIIASTVARYPKGKLIMAEPYDVPNLSFLPAFDSSKEEMVPIWRELVDRLGMNLKLNHTVETVERRQDGLFSVHSAGQQILAQRVVLATGLRGKPRTLGVPGENQAKVCSLLEDPDELRGRAVCVVGGGDSALEAAIALADAGAKVVLSYRGRSFSRAQPKNKAQAEAYAAERRVKIKYQSQVVEFGPDTVTLQMSDGSQKRYPNDAAFVLIGADPPIKWLNRLGIRYVERPHMFALSGTDELVRRALGDNVRECPTTAEAAAALVQGRQVPEHVAPRAPSQISHITEAPGASAPRRFIRAATQMFRGGQKLEKPMPLSEFARQQRRHSGRGRRDALEPGERTRILRMLRDDGARRADDDSKVHFIEDLAQARRPGGSFHQPAPGEIPIEDLDLEPEIDQSPKAHRSGGPLVEEPTTQAPAPVRPSGAPVPKQAVIVGLARATAQGPRQPRELPELFRLPDSPGESRRPPPTPRRDEDPTQFAPMPFAPADEPTQFMPEERGPRARHAPPPPQPNLHFDDDEQTRLANFDPQDLMRKAAEVDARRGQRSTPPPPPPGHPRRRLPPPTPGHATRAEPAGAPFAGPTGGRTPMFPGEKLFSDDDVENATAAIDLNRAPSHADNEETRAMGVRAAAGGGDTHVDVLSDVDWDLE